MMIMMTLSSQRRRLDSWNCSIEPRSEWLGISCLCSSLALVLGDVSCDASHLSMALRSSARAHGACCRVRAGTGTKRGPHTT